MRHKTYSPLACVWAKAIETEMALVDDVPDCCRDEVMTILADKQTKRQSYQSHQGYPASHAKQDHYMPQVYNSGTGNEIMQARTLLSSVIPSANGSDVPSHIQWTSQLNINKLEQAVTRAEKNPTEANMKSLRSHLDKFQRALRSGHLAKTIY